MVMDKGLSLRQAEDLISAGEQYIDLVKLGFGSSYITNNLQEKIDLYHNAGMKVYLGGTLFEAFVARGKFRDYVKMMNRFKIETVEVSDGSIVLEHGLKCRYIKELAKEFTVLSEVGSKEEGILISPAKWTRMMENELEAGSWKVIAEARESGTVGIYRPSGKAHSVLVNRIIAKVDPKNIIWEAPIKSQQVYFIKQFGANVNLGNIAPHEVIAMETLRLGLRGDTFFDHLPERITEALRQQIQEQEPKNGKG
jgi:phosphosulfolactate synthase